MRSTIVVAVVALLGGVVISGIGAAEPLGDVSSLDSLGQEKDSLECKLATIGEAEAVLSKKVEDLAHEIEGLEAELKVRHGILGQYRLAGYLRRSDEAIARLEAVREEKRRVSEELRELRRQLTRALRERRHEFVEMIGTSEGEDLREHVYQIALITLDLEGLREEPGEEAEIRRVEIEVDPGDSPAEIREKAEIVAREAAKTEEMGGTVHRRIEELEEEELVREKLIELKEEVAWLEEEAVSSLEAGKGGYLWSEQRGPTYDGPELGEVLTIRGISPMESREAFFGAGGAARIAEIKKERESLEEQSRSLSRRADSLGTLAERLLKIAEEMDELEK